MIVPPIVGTNALHEVSRIVSSNKNAACVVVGGVDVVWDSARGDFFISTNILAEFAAVGYAVKVSL